MNQHDQMLREALQALYDVQNGPPLEKYRYEWNLAMVLAENALAAEPAPLVMVTDLEMLDMYCEPNSDKEMFEFGRAVQKRFLEKNGLKHEPN